MTEGRLQGLVQRATPEPVLQLRELLLQGAFLGTAGLQCMLCLSSSTALSIQLQAGDM